MPYGGDSVLPGSVNLTPKKGAENGWELIIQCLVLAFDKTVFMSGPRSGILKKIAVILCFEDRMLCISFIKRLFSRVRKFDFTFCLGVWHLIIFNVTPS